MRRAFDEHGSFTLDVDGEDVKLEPTDVEIRAEQHEDLTLAQDGPHAVALDLTLDDDLRAEGMAREIIRAVNDRRKTNGFALADRITVVLRSTARIGDAGAPPRGLDRRRGAGDVVRDPRGVTRRRPRRNDRRRTPLARPAKQVVLCRRRNAGSLRRSRSG